MAWHIFIFSIWNCSNIMIVWNRMGQNKKRLASGITLENIHFTEHYLRMLIGLKVSRYLFYWNNVCLTKHNFRVKIILGLKCSFYQNLVYLAIAGTGDIITIIYMSFVLDSFKQSLVWEMVSHLLPMDCLLPAQKDYNYLQREKLQLFWKSTQGTNVITIISKVSTCSQGKIWRKTYCFLFKGPPL